MCSIWFTLCPQNLNWAWYVVLGINIPRMNQKCPFLRSG